MVHVMGQIVEQQLQKMYEHTEKRVDREVAAAKVSAEAAAAERQLERQTRLAGIDRYPNTVSTGLYPLSISYRVSSELTPASQSQTRAQVEVQSLICSQALSLFRITHVPSHEVSWAL